MTDEMVSEFKQHQLETPIPVKIESQSFVSKSMTPKVSLQASGAEVVLPVETAIAKESVGIVEGLPNERVLFASDIVRESNEVVQKVNETVEMATMSSTEDSESAC